MDKVAQTHLDKTRSYSTIKNPLLFWPIGARPRLELKITGPQKGRVLQVPKDGELYVPRRGRMAVFWEGGIWRLRR